MDAREHGQCKRRGEEVGVRAHAQHEDEHVKAASANTT
jgi:hypothetical protein